MARPRFANELDRFTESIERIAFELDIGVPKLWDIPTGEGWEVRELALFGYVGSGGVPERPDTLRELTRTESLDVGTLAVRAAVILREPGPTGQQREYTAELGPVALYLRPSLYREDYDGMPTMPLPKPIIVEPCQKFRIEVAADNFARIAWFVGSLTIRRIRAQPRPVDVR